MTLNPVIPLPLLIPLAVALCGFAAWRLVREAGPGRFRWLRSSSLRSAWFLRALMVLLLLVIALRPAIPGSGTGPVATGGLEVYFVVDTTSSMAAEDVDLAADDRPGTRLDGVRADVDSITEALVGAQFSLTTFDSTTIQRVPLTSDTTAVASAASVLRQEITYYSQGSGIDAPLTFMTELLAEAQGKHPDRQRVLFYLGDGEQTREQDPASFDALEPYISGGAVLGYGTADGGIMRIFDGFGADDDPAKPVYILDPTTSVRAISRIDESNLEQIAGQLGVRYRHSATGQGIDELVRGIDVGETAVSEGTLEGPIEFYWIFAVPLGLLALRELIAACMAIVDVRPARGGSNDRRQQ